MVSSDGKSLHIYSVNADVPQSYAFERTVSYYTFSFCKTFLMMFSLMLLSMLKIIQFTLNIVMYLTWKKKQTKIGFWTKLYLLDTAYWSTKVIADFDDGKNNLDWFNCTNKSHFLDLKLDGIFLKEKSSFKILKVSLSSKLDRGYYIMFVVETTSNIWSIFFFEVFVFLYCFLSI